MSTSNTNFPVSDPHKTFNLSDGKVFTVIWKVQDRDLTFFRKILATFTFQHLSECQVRIELWQYTSDHGWERTYELGQTRFEGGFNYEKIRRFLQFAQQKFQPNSVQDMAFREARSSILSQLRMVR